MKSSDKQKLRSLGQSLTDIERLVILQTLGVFDIRKIMIEDIQEEHFRIFGTRISQESVIESVKDMLF